MPRLDPRFNAVDIIRMVENNLTLADKRVVFAWFFSLIPIKEPKVDVVGILLDLIAAIPVAGTAAKILQVSVEVAQVAVDIANLFQFEFEEQDVELAKVLNELEILREEFMEQRNALLRAQIAVDAAREQIAALNSTIELLNDENRLLSQMQEGELANVEQIRTAVQRGRASLANLLTAAGRLSPSTEQVFILNAATNIGRRFDQIEGVL